MSGRQFRSRASIFFALVVAVLSWGCNKDDGGGADRGASGPANVYGQVILSPLEGLDDLSLVEVTLRSGDDEGGTIAVDDAGVFEFEDLSPGAYSLDVAYPAGLEGAKESAYRPFEARFSVDAAGTINLGRLELELGVGQVAGSVSFGDSEGAEEATVSLQGSSGAFQQSTDSGAFSFQDVTVGYLSLIVQRDGFTACEEPVVVRYHGEEVDSALSLSSKAVTLQPSGDTQVNVEGDTRFLEDSSATEVSLAVSASFATAARFWAAGADIPEFEDFSDDDVLVVPGLAAGRSTYKFQFRSACGLESEVFQRDFVRDSEPPTVDFVTLNSGIPVSQSRTMALSGSARDEVSSSLEMRIALCDVDGDTVDCNPTLEDAPWEPYQFSRSVTFSDVSGQKRIIVQFRDQNANETDAFEADVIFDPDPPSGISLTVNEILVGESNIIHDNLPLITISGDGIDEMRVGLEAGLGGVTWRPFQSAFRFEIPGADGTYTLYFQFRDAAGNETSIISVPFVMDRTGGLIGHLKISSPSIVITIK